MAGWFFAFGHTKTRQSRLGLWPQRCDFERTDESDRRIDEDAVLASTLRRRRRRKTKWEDEVLNEESRSLVLLRNRVVRQTEALRCRSCEGVGCVAGRHPCPSQ